MAECSFQISLGEPDKIATLYCITWFSAGDRLRTRWLWEIVMGNSSWFSLQVQCFESSGVEGSQKLSLSDLTVHCSKGNKPVVPLFCRWEGKRSYHLGAKGQFLSSVSRELAGKGDLSFLSCSHDFVRAKAYWWSSWGNPTLLFIGLHLFLGEREAIYFQRCQSGIPSHHQKPLQFISPVLYSSLLQRVYCKDVLTSKTPLG